MPTLFKRVCYLARKDKAIAWSMANYAMHADPLFPWSARIYPSTKGITTGSSNAVMIPLRPIARAAKAPICSLS